MTDLHTHILPGMDDGAPDVSVSLQMLRMEREQGVDTVALTPHFYREREAPSAFLNRRQKAYETLLRALDELPPEERETMPRLVLGAEIAWMPNLADWPELERMRYGESRYFLLEPPMEPWEKTVLRQLYELVNRSDFTPVIAHVDRYLDLAPKSVLKELFSLELPIQISAEMFLHFRARGRALRLLRNEESLLLISDCHNVAQRPPNIGPALAAIRRRLGADAEEAVKADSDALLSIR